jgi:electron transfer flavoprotein beta subunit
MKIAVCVKEVPDAGPNRRIDPETKRMDRSGDRSLNQYDLNAIEQALRLKEAAGDGEVVLVSVGTGRALDSIRKGLGMGADRAVLVSDEAAAGSDLVATTNVLSAALQAESPDVVLFGQQATDGDGAVLWAAVADRLKMPVISQISELEVADGHATAKRQTEFGYDTIRAPLPVVLAVADSLNEPRYPSLKGIMGAKKKPQEVKALADVGVDAGQAGEAGSRTTVIALNPPPSRGETIKIEDDGSGAQKILDFLLERKLV